MTELEQAANAAGIIDPDYARILEVPTGKTAREVISALKIEKPYLFQPHARNLSPEEKEKALAKILRTEPRDYAGELAKVTGGKSAADLDDATYNRALRAIGRF